MKTKVRQASRYVPSHGKPNPGITKAANYFGSVLKMAIELRVAYSTARRWLYGTCPKEAAIRIEKATKRAVRREMIRPDLFA